MADKVEIRELFRLIRSIPKWKTFDVSEANLDLWCKYFRHCPIKVLRKVIGQLVTEIKWKPDICDVYKKAKALAGISWSKTKVKEADSLKDWYSEKLGQKLVPIHDMAGNALNEWRSAQQCGLYNGKPVLLIDYVCSKLGDKYVNKTIRNRLQLGDTALNSKGFIKKLSSNHYLNKYPEILQELVEQAKNVV